jgi:hypothetical protein
MGIATAVRAAIPLGLMTDAPGPTIMNVVKPGSSLLPPPVGDWDREERRVLMFTVLLFDINASSSSGWPNMMMTDELVSLKASVSLKAYPSVTERRVLMVVYEITMFKSRLGIIRTSIPTSHVRR